MFGRIYYSHREDRLRVDVNHYSSRHHLQEGDKIVSEFSFDLKLWDTKKREVLDAWKIFTNGLKLVKMYYFRVLLVQVIEEFLNHAFTAEGIRCGTRTTEIEKFFASYGLKIELIPIENLPSQPVT